MALIGIPYDGGVSYRTGARYGPRHVREQSSLIRPWNPVLQVSPFEKLRVADCGDVDVVPISIEATFAAIEREMDRLAAGGVIPLSVGGDHSITLPILRSLKRRHGRLGLVHFDSHPDTWDEYFGSKYFHGTTFRRAMEEDLIDGHRVIQIGIRGPLYGADDFDFHREHGFEFIRVETVKELGTAWVAERLKRLRAGPSTARSTSMPSTPPTPPPPARRRWAGSPRTRPSSLVRALRGLDLIGADVVEVSPPYDGPGQITSLLAANLIFELLSLLALRR